MNKIKITTSAGEIEVSEAEIEALKQSIKKWALISVGLGKDRQYKNCALCQIYIKKNNKYMNCKECIIETIGNGNIGCLDTPYEDWGAHAEKHKLFVLNGMNEQDEQAFHVKCGKCRELANKELMFLQKILEKIKYRDNEKEKS
jgi:hypothetical protein